MNNKNEIEVSKVINSNLANDKSKGEMLFKEISKYIAEYTVILNFNGINLINTAFLNDAIGVLIRDYGLINVTSKLRITNIDKEDMDMFKEVLKNAADKYVKTRNNFVNY